MTTQWKVCIFELSKLPATWRDVPTVGGAEDSLESCLTFRPHKCEPGDWASHSAETSHDREFFGSDRGGNGGDPEVLGSDLEFSARDREVWDAEPELPATDPEVAPGDRGGGWFHREVSPGEREMRMADRRVWTAGAGSVAQT